MAVGAPSRISISCPNVATWYKIYRPLFKNSGVSKRAASAATTAATTATTTSTAPVLSKSSISQLGTVIGLLL